ncbi:PREDICTED: uncharacterized protein LOC108618408 [Drosophila arizonae]|uniref:Uncharacterized protein LOC108618408 n=1 Tax=Drosophila arizonae TaxID=7263 RepID=A0ABM1PRR0_DROAR|nr:PREDICTED: uncharacterized protein LOC108618408 [Drosophila arizonae]
MKLLHIVLLCLGLWLCLCPVPGEARRLQREASAAPEPLLNAELAAGESLKSEEFVSDATTTPKPLGIVSIKSRAIAMDRALCKEQSRYHPHFPKCHQYCKRLDHWIGQCWRESCHCIS